MDDDEYAELARALLARMGEFIGQSEPGENLIPLHRAYTVVKNTVAARNPDSEISKSKRRLEDAQRTVDELRDKQQRQERESAKANAERQARWARQAGPHDAWKGLDREARKGRILTVLGGESLTRGEIAKRLPREYPDIDIYSGGNELVPLLNDMLAAGELEREKEPRAPNCTIRANSGYRWRWRRSRKPLSPALLALEQRLKEV